MKKPLRKRSWATTIIAGVIGLIILILIFPLIPLDNWSEAAFFSVGLLLVVLCVVVAIDGKKGTIKDIIYSLGFWN